MAFGARFEFTQERFDLIGSDLSAFSVARAGTNATTIPVFLTPISLRNYERPEDYREPAWIASALSVTNAPSRQLVAREARSHRAAKDYPYVHVRMAAVRTILDYVGLTRQTTKQTLL